MKFLTLLEDFTSISDKCASQLADGVIGHRENMCSESKLANQHFDKFFNAVKKLASHEDVGLSALSQLLDDPTEIVRATAGHYLIHRFPDKVVPVLQSLVNERGQSTGASTSALITLEKWKRGMYFDPSTGKEEAKEKLLT